LRPAATPLARNPLGVVTVMVRLRTGTDPPFRAGRA
jgi:hypothetical protein